VKHKRLLILLGAATGTAANHRTLRCRPRTRLTLRCSADPRTACARPPRHCRGLAHAAGPAGAAATWRAAYHKKPPLVRFGRDGVPLALPLAWPLSCTLATGVAAGGPNPSGSSPEAISRSLNCLKPRRGLRGSSIARLNLSPRACDTASQFEFLTGQRVHPAAILDNPQPCLHLPQKQAAPAARSPSPEAGTRRMACRQLGFRCVRVFTK